MKGKEKNKHTHSGKPSKIKNIQTNQSINKHTHTHRHVHTHTDTYIDTHTPTSSESERVVRPTSNLYRHLPCQCLHQLRGVRVTVTRVHPKLTVPVISPCIDLRREGRRGQRSEVNGRTGGKGLERAKEREKEMKQRLA